MRYLERRAETGPSLQARILIDGASKRTSKAVGGDPLIYERILGRIGFWLQVDPQNVTAQKLERMIISEIQKNEFRYADQLKGMPSVDDFARRNSNYAVNENL